MTKLQREVPPPAKQLPKSVDFEHLDSLGMLGTSFVESCDRHLLPLDVESGPKPFRFPYLDLEAQKIRFAEGLMEAEKLTIGGHVYAIDAPGPIILTRLEFPGGFNGETRMEGSLGGLIPSPVATTVSTPTLYKFLDELRRGLPKGTQKNLPTQYGDVEFEAI